MPMLSGKGKGLVLAVDKGFSIEAYNHRMSDGDNSLRDLLNTEDPVLKADSISAYIASPHRSTARKQGRYMMTDLKKITGTKNFFKLPDKVKGCQIDTEGECKRRRFRTRLLKKCGCLPWALKSRHEVWEHKHFYIAYSTVCEWEIPTGNDSVEVYIVSCHKLETPIFLSGLKVLKQEGIWIVSLKINFCFRMSTSVVQWTIPATTGYLKTLVVSLLAQASMQMFTSQKKIQRQHKKRVFKKFRRLTNLYNSYTNKISLNLSPGRSLNQSGLMFQN